MAIQPEQLNVQLERLEQTFGDKPFGDQRARMIWLAVEGLEYDSVIAIVDGFIRSSKTAPLPKDFADAAKEYDRKTVRYSLGECVPREIAKCFDCADSGFVRVIRRAGAEAWAKFAEGSAACHCERGAQLLEGLRKRKRHPIDLVSAYSERWRSSYAIEPWHPAQAPTMTFAQSGMRGDGEGA